MSTIFFMALQCCQCSTMQVKQRKQSSKSKKWTCVVCNQKQSTRRVFAQGPMAKDLRLFVQSFNMPRQSDPNPQPLDLEEQLEVEVHSKRPQTDWTEFLDPDVQISKYVEREDRTGFVDEPEIVTELPMGIFKKAKLNKFGGTGGRSESGDGEGGDKLHGPVFSKRNDKEPMDHGLRTTMDDTSKWSHKMREDDQKPRICPLTKGRVASSKWSNYIIQDDDNSPCVNAGKFEKQSGDWSNNILETLTNEERVEDDEVHPDFL